ncbi:MAG: type 1 glutamine amidotransferase [Bacteroidota bacterium]
MRAHYLQHVPFEGLGCIEPWLKAAGYEITHTRLFESTQFPEPNELDLLVVMGGPMSANDEGRLPWLIQEKQFIHRCLRGGKSILGVCLGAQLIASAMGARVYRNREKEIGWFPVEGVLPAGSSTFRFPTSAEVFHWHGETFDLPPGAIRLARSEGCENQAFQVERNVIGLQFHLEITPVGALALLENCRSDLTPGPYVQIEQELRAAPASRYHAINGIMDDILAYLSRLDRQPA